MNAAIPGHKCSLPGKKPRIVSIHGPHPLSGVSTWIARLLRAKSTRYDWHALIVGRKRDIAAMPPFPASQIGRVHLRAWSNDEHAVTDHIDSVRTAIRELNPALVIPNYVPEAYAAAGLEAPHGVRTLGVCHSRDYWYLELFQHTAPLMHGAWAVSNECDHLIRTTLDPTTPILSAPYGTDLPEDHTPPPFLNDTSGPIRLLYTGRLETRQKRAMHLATLAEELQRRNVPFVFTLAGDGPDHVRLTERLAPLITSGRVNLLGSVPHERIDELIREHDLLVMVSAFEGTPLAAIEAMALGRPIAVTDGCGGAVDIISALGGGIVVPVEQSIQLAEHIEKLQRNPDQLRALSLQARKAAEERFALTQHITSLERLIDKALAAPDIRTPSTISRTWKAILDATGLAEGGWPTYVCRTALRRWRSEYLKANEVPRRAVALPGRRFLRSPKNNIDLPATAPRIQRLGATLLATAAEELVREGHHRIAIFPAGRHSARHAMALADSPYITCFVDDAADSTPQRTLHGKPVLSPACALENGIDAIIISSDEYEEALECRAREWGNRLIIRTLYVPVRIPMEHLS